MTQVNAAVVTSFAEPPHYQPFELPDRDGPDQITVEVLAAGLHPRVRSGARGAHYTSTGTLPMVPGVDGVGRRPDGALVYFAADDEVVGTMAERVTVDARRTLVLPESVDVAAIAAAMNLAMSSWVALRRRSPIQPGQRVLVLGATGNAGTMAVQIARLLGAGEVVGAGRNGERLAALASLGADAVVRLTADAEETRTALADAAADIDIVLDYLWGAPAELAMDALLHARGDRSRWLEWIQIGAPTGASIQLPAVYLRSANLHLQGSGQGSVSPAAYLAELPPLVEAIHAGRIAVTTRTAPLVDVERIWTEPDPPGVRTVLVTAPIPGSAQPG